MAVNPRFRIMEVGVRSVRNVNIYPMSMADELTLTSAITDAFNGFQNLNKQALPDIDDNDDFEQVLRTAEDDEITPEAVLFVIQAIKDNLLSILKMVCDEEITLNDLTNEQFAELCEVIYDMNFAGAVGKFQSLWMKIKTIFPQTKQLQKSSSQPATPSTTSTGTVSSKEE